MRICTTFYSIALFIVISLNILTSHASRIDLEDRSRERIGLEKVPRLLIKQIVEFSVDPSLYGRRRKLDYKERFLTLGKVSKKMYGIYSSEFILGETNGMGGSSTKVKELIYKMLSGIPVNFYVSRRMGAFDFRSCYKGMVLIFNHYHYKDYNITTAILKGTWEKNKKRFYRSDYDEWIEISSYPNDILTSINNAWPFAGISKIIFTDSMATFSESQQSSSKYYSFNKREGSEIAVGCARYTIYGIGPSGNKINVSYTFRRSSRSLS
jgi:hypothetical protein